MVVVDRLSRRFGHVRAVDGISVRVQRGEVLGFLGPNGSGKSTTMKMITGFLEPSAGRVEICGVDVAADRIVAQRHLGYLPEGAPAYPDMTPRAYLEFIADVRRLEGSERTAAIARVVRLTHITGVLHQPIETLSKGFKRRVGIAQALLHDPPVLILDEPTDGLDPNQKYEVRTLIRVMAPHKAIIVSTHILEEVEAVCTRALIIAEGRIVADGTPGALVARSSTHNAVVVSAAADRAEALGDVLRALDGVERVERRTGSDGEMELVAMPRAGRDIVTDIAGVVRQGGWPVEQIRRERGNLDEVFRALTAPGGAEAQPPASNPMGDRKQTAGGGLSTLRDVWTVCRREFAGYFATPVAYVFLVIFLATLGALTFFLGGFFEQGRASLDGFFQFHPWLYLFLVPAISMRLWAEERRSGSIELLLSLPVTTVGAVVGKFLAAWAVAGIGLVLTMTMWGSVEYLGDPDHGTIAAGYLGSFFMAGGYLAIGAFVSALTRNQVIAFILAAALCFAFTASGLGVVLEFFSGWAPRAALDAVASFSFLVHFRDFSRGVLDLRDVAFFLTTIAFFLFANVVAVETRKNA